MVILFLPLLQHSFSFVKSGPLKGGFKDADDVVFSIQGWIDGSYQHQKERFLNDKTGFRADMVRINNQIDFALFDKCHAGWTLAGRNNNLFQAPYIDAYYGNDFVGYDTILEKTRKLKAIQDTLNHLGKSLVLVYAPSKATYCPEDIPEHLVQQEGRMTNYKAYRRTADSFGIHQIDMDAWFVSMKNKSKELLFSKQCIHWTIYGAILAGDSLIRYIENLRSVHVPHPEWSKTEHTDKPRYGDDDVAAELNLIFPIARETFGYPEMRDVQDSGAKKINAMYICDSWGFKMAGSGIVSKMNAQCEVWYYFKEIVDVNNGNKWIAFKDYDWKDAVNKTDCVVLVYTSFNLKELGSGFIETAYDHYYPKK